MTETNHMEAKGGKGGRKLVKVEEVPFDNQLPFFLNHISH